MELKFKTISGQDKLNNVKDIEACAYIAKSNMENARLIEYSDLIIADYNEQDELVGYAALVFGAKRRLCLYSIAVDRNLKGKHGIGGKLLNFIFKNSKSYNIIESNYKHENIASHEFHKKNGFKIVNAGSDNNFVELVIDRRLQETSLLAATHTTRTIRKRKIIQLIKNTAKVGWCFFS